MRKIAAFLTITLLISSFGLKEKGYAYESNEAKMSIKFPAEFEVSTIEKEKATTYKAQVQDGGMLFMASSSVHKSTLENDIDGLLETSLNSFRESLNGTIVSSESIELKGTKGTYAVLTLGQNNSKLEYRVFLKDNMQYQIITAQLDAEYDQESADAFYKSFKILK